MDKPVFNVGTEELKSLWQERTGERWKEFENKVLSVRERWLWNLALLCMAGNDFDRAARTLNEGRAIWTTRDEMDYRHQVRNNLGHAGLRS